MYKTKRFLLGFISLFFVLSCENDDFFIDTSFHDLHDARVTSIDIRIPYISQLSQQQDSLTLLCNVSVFDQTLFPLFNLVESNFELFISYPDDDGNLYCVKNYFIVDDDTYPSVTVITMDYSGSMSNTDVMHMEEGVTQYINSLGENDKVQIIKFASYVEVMNEFTSDKDILLRAVSEPFNRGMTAFYDGVYLGLNNIDEFMIENPEHTPLVIAFTDGHDNYSSTRLEALMDFSKELQIPVYTVGLGRVDSDILSSIASETGGFFQYTESAQDISNLFEIINEHVDNLYKINVAVRKRPVASVDLIVHVFYENANGMHQAQTRQTFSFPE